MAASQHEIEQVIADQAAVLRCPGVLSVRPGYEITDGWLTGRPAIVVTMRAKLASPPAGQQLPDQLGGIAVDVRQASVVKRLSLEDPEAYLEEHRLNPDTGAVPEFATERVMVAQKSARSTAPQSSATAAVAKPQLPYSGPPGSSLRQVTGQMTLHLSASPDTGWPTLKAFLGDVASTLTVGMYDFTSAHILSWLSTSLLGKQLRLVLDHPPKNPTADQTDEATIAGLRTALGGQLKPSWALTRLDKLASAWIYPTSYHIKVAVRDSKVFWLSSGNWNNSNQPDITPATTPADAEAARHDDRDWHVIVEHPGLAATFEKYLINDLTIAGQHNTAPVGTPTPLPPPVPGQNRTPAFGQFFPIKTITGRITVKPLLTPDPGVYAKAVLDLINKAKTSLYLQFQYITLPSKPDPAAAPFLKLVHAVIARQLAGVEVKLIMSEYETAGYLEQLQALGLDVVNSVKIQNNVHNKGIVADGSSVLISSQNWSTDGTLFNRDAGLIIHHPDAAQYYQAIFLHDWDHLAQQKVQPD